ncbi:MAG: SLBB domain-containing protein [candidate division Zixibacteria bacterium]|nr:SLBB domain-containing protein [candidate division Zixibacteria bacterium]
MKWAEEYRFFDKPVDPDIYLIRPGEELQVTFIKAKLSCLKLSVGPEGKIVDRNLGLCDLSGMTLRETQELLVDSLSKLYNADKIVISVTEPHRVAISVSGAVSHPGLYKGFTSQRVSELIDKAGGILPHGSTRGIIFSGGPRDLTVDLDRATYLGDNASNPCLYAGYSLNIPGKLKDRIEVIGEVNNPRQIELLPNDDLVLLLRLAGGVRSAADTGNIQILDRVVSNREEGLKPKAGDVVFVPPVKASPVRNRLIIFGAIDDPGHYDFHEGITLDQLIEQAGGFIDVSNSSLVTVFRKARTDEWGRSTDTRYPVISIPDYEGEALSMFLQPTDSVFVPFAVGYVMVTGYVFNPGRFPFNPEKNAMFYINAAGGFLPKADDNRIDVYNRVTRVTTNVSTGVMIHDGDKLIVNVREESR